MTLEPSDLLKTKTNVLKFIGVSNGNNSDPAITIGVKARSADIFSGSEIAVNGKGIANTFIDGEVTMNLALGLACVGPAPYPESAQHIKEAQALGYARIVTKDTDPVRVAQRRSSSTKECVKTPVLGLDCDEYPQAMFVENAGAAHVKKITKGDNRGSGRKVAAYAQAHLEFGQLEVVVPNRGLNCQDAF